MKLNPNSIHPQISEEQLEKKLHEGRAWEHPWNKHMREWDAEKIIKNNWNEVDLNKPKPPTPEAVEKAKFKDKTYRWNGR